MKSSAYILQPTEKSFCPTCHSKVHLLCHRSGNFSDFPAFYICPSCGHVAQNGVGPVTGTLPIVNPEFEAQVNSLCELFLGDKIPLDIHLVSTGEVIYATNRKVTKALIRKIVRNRLDIEMDASPYKTAIFNLLKIRRQSP